MIYVLLFFILGLIFGSFLNALIYRWKRNLSLWERSFCPRCKHVLAVWDLAPILSFVFLGAKCRYCHKPISSQYPLVELITGVLFALVWLKNGEVNLALLACLYFILILIFTLVFDWKYYLILDKIIWPSLIIAFILNLILGFDIWSLLIGLLIGAGFFGLQYLLSQGKWVGDGDIKLGALLGVMLGWQLTILTILLAYLIGGVAAIILLAVKKKKFGDVLPMGTFLCVAAIIVLLWGEVILNW